MLSDPSGGGYAAYGAARAPSRDELIKTGMELVRRIAFRMVRRLPPNVEVDDLIGAGAEGLIKAVGAYNPERHPNFEPYAKVRIRGAILDELRANDSLTRYGRSRLSEVSTAIRDLQSELGRQPSEDEVADRLGIPLEQYQRLAGDLARGPALTRLGAVDPDDVDGQSQDPSSAYDDVELKQQLVEAMKSLPERTQKVLALYYQEECTQAEIGEILGVTESRVCQILGEASARLRALMGVKGPGPGRAKKRSRK